MRYRCEFYLVKIKYYFCSRDKKLVEAMEEKILEALKAKFKNGNASALALLAEKLAKGVTNDEQLKTAVDGVTQKLLEVVVSYGDNRATEATKTAVQNYENKHGLKDGKPVNGGGTNATNSNGANSTTTTQATNNTTGGDTVPAWAKELLESNKTLSERLNKLDTERITASRKQQLSKVYEKLPAELRKPFERLTVETLTDEAFSTLVTEVTSDVEKLAAVVKSKGAVFGKPAAHAGGEKVEEELTKEQKEAIAKRDGVASKEAQPF